MSDFSLRVREIIAGSIALCPIAPEEMREDTQLGADLTADSLDKVEMAMTAEEAFRISISDEALEEVKTVGDFVALVDALVTAKGADA